MASSGPCAGCSLVVPPGSGGPGGPPVGSCESSSSAPARKFSQEGTSTRHWGQVMGRGSPTLPTCPSGAGSCRVVLTQRIAHLTAQERWHRCPLSQRASVRSAGSRTSWHTWHSLAREVSPLLPESLPQVWGASRACVRARKRCAKMACGPASGAMLRGSSSCARNGQFKRTKRVHGRRAHSVSRGS